MNSIFNLLTNKPIKKDIHIHYLTKIQILEEKIKEIRENQAILAKNILFLNKNDEKNDENSFKELIDQKLNQQIEKITEIIQQELNRKFDEKPLKHLNSLESANFNKLQKNESLDVSEIIPEEIEIKVQTTNTNQSTKIIPLSNIVLDNKKEVIQQQILNTITDNEINISKLKNVVVNKNKFCSKSTFYRHIKELQKDGQIGIILANNQTIVIKNNLIENK